MFVSPLFYVLLGSLYIALLSCVLTRGRALVIRTLRRYPRTPQYWGEWGSWLFHTSFFLLVVAVVWGKATGFDGIMTITEGQRVAETRASYDTLQEGMLFDGHHSGYEVQLNRFSAPLQANGMPSDFVSNMTVYDAASRCSPRTSASTSTSATTASTSTSRTTAGRRTWWCATPRARWSATRHPDDQ